LRYSAIVGRATACVVLGIVVGAFVSAPHEAHATGGIRNGPWLMEPGTDAITLMLERSTPGDLHVRLWPVNAPDRVHDFADAAPVRLHEMRLAGLVAGTRYRYETSGDGLVPSSGTFSTAPSNAAPFRFVVYGDTRSDASIHARMVRAIHAEGADFVLHTGDLVADGRDDGLWHAFFGIEHDLLRDTPLVPVIGNHEIMRPGSTGIEAFRRYVHCDPASPEPELDYSFGFGAVRFVVLNAFDDWTASARRTWLEDALTRARREVPDGFVIVAMHWGVCSCGPHGENRGARAAGLDDLLRRHGVDLLVSGHDHIFERGEDHGLRYLVSGGGGAPLYRRARVRPYAQAFASEHHFVRADVESDGIVFTAVRPDGSVLDRCTLRHTGWDCPRSPIAPRMSMADVFVPSCACNALASHESPRPRCFTGAALLMLSIGLRRRRTRSDILRAL
jgi:predicted phosphodiesterase